MRKPERGRGRGRDRQTCVRETLSVASCTHPNQGLNLLPQERPRVRTTQLSCSGFPTPPCEIINVYCCFQLPSSGVICYTAKDKNTKGIHQRKTLAYHSTLTPPPRQSGFLIQTYLSVLLTSPHLNHPQLELALSQCGSQPSSTGIPGSW